MRWLLLLAVPITYPAPANQSSGACRVFTQSTAAVKPTHTHTPYA